MISGRRARGVAFALALAPTMVLAAPAGVRATPFVDVPAGHWAYAAIQMLATGGLIDGYPDGAFDGERPLTRDEMAAIVARVVARLDVESAHAVSKADLDALQKSMGARSDELDALGVRVTILEDRLDARGRRRPLAQSPVVHGALAVAETSCAGVANPAVRTLAADGLIDGFPGGAFAGDRPLTRYEMAAIVARVVARMAADGAQTASRADLATLQRSGDVLAAGLGALGVRVTALEGHLAAFAERTSFAPSLSAGATLAIAGTHPAAIDPPVGTLARDRPLTRDETAAIVARVVAMLDTESAQTASNVDLAMLRQLSDVLAGELAALDARVIALERQLAALDASARTTT